jgi:hypothetical protein
MSIQCLAGFQVRVGHLLLFNPVVFFETQSRIDCCKFMNMAAYAAVLR